MSNKKLQITFVLTTMLLVLIVLSFSTFLNVNSFEQNYAESLTSTYKVIGGQGVRKIEYAVEYGKELDKFYGIKEILTEIKDDSKHIEQARIVLPDGEISYNLAGRVNNKELSSALKGQINFAESDKEYKTILEEGKYHLLIPIRDETNQYLGSLELIFPKRVIEAQTRVYLEQIIKFSLILALIVLVALLFAVWRMNPLDDDGALRKKFIILMILVILGATQLAYGFVNYKIFKRAYIDITRENASAAVQTIKDDVNSVLEKGVIYDELYQFKDWLTDIVDEVPEIDQIYLTDTKDRVMVTTSPVEEKNILDSDYTNSSLLPTDLSGARRVVNVGISQDYINQKLKNIVLDMLTVLIVSFVFTVELTLFTVIFLKEQLEKNREGESAGTKLMDINLNRTLTFLFFTASTMPLSFIPLVMNDLYQPLGGLSKDVILGLPISAEMLFAGLSMTLAGHLIDKKGWKPVFIPNLVIFIAGTVLAGFAWNSLVFVAARSLVGLGYGACLVAMMNLAVVSTNSEEEKSRSLSAHNSGIFAGANCGVVVGGMIADRIGFYRVFWLAAGVSLLAGFFALYFLPNIKESSAEGAVPAEDAVQGSSKDFFSNLNVITYFLLLLVPATVANMFLKYFFPLFAENLGVSSSNIGRAFLINGIMIAYIGPLVTKYVADKLSTKRATILSSAIIIIGFAVFFIKGSLLTAFLVVLLLGLANGFGLVVRNNYLLKLNAAQRLGRGKALSYYNMARKVGQVIGPVVFGTALALGTELGVGVIALTLLITLIIFALVNHPQQIKQDKVEQVEGDGYGQSG
ncbi:MAG: MFS transporter [Halanaerobacter sp.]